MLRADDRNRTEGETVMADDNDAQANQRAPQPDPPLKSLGVMVGTWDLKGRESGPD